MRKQINAITEGLTKDTIVESTNKTTRQLTFDLNTDVFNALSNIAFQYSLKNKEDKFTEGKLRKSLETFYDKFFIEDEEVGESTVNEANLKIPSDKDLKSAIKSNNPNDLEELLASLPKFTEIYYIDKNGNKDFGRKLSGIVTLENDAYKNSSFSFRSEWLYGDDTKTTSFDIVLKKCKEVSFSKLLKINESRKPKYWNSIFAGEVIRAYKDGDLEKNNIEEWETEYNGGVKPVPSLGTKEILNYYLSTGEEPGK